MINVNPAAITGHDACSSASARAATPSSDSLPMGGTSGGESLDALGFVGRRPDAEPIAGEPAGDP
jgi:hypothetical protein